jgi:hypothetical protein
LQGAMAITGADDTRHGCAVQLGQAEVV